ncbi:hypothetical protein Y032_0009g611 [Ancylostoma ceylanicum]|uniref:Uncharacterized protein n=1 Tax=Ancylostoma ceylanicum TaxID=53326 RepID=A0A016VKF5_9BILA|nr:hypothetical protein Y032_0009g611 [Ancylostoma ceylanicum]
MLLSFSFSAIHFVWSSERSQLTEIYNLQNISPESTPSISPLVISVLLKHSLVYARAHRAIIAIRVFILNST